jgi:hypothetical protein
MSFCRACRRCVERSAFLFFFVISFCRGSRACVSYSVSYFLLSRFQAVCCTSASYFLLHFLLSELQGLCYIFCFLLSVAVIGVRDTEYVFALTFSCGMSCCRDYRACVACSVSFFLWHIFLSGCRSCVKCPSCGIFWCRSCMVCCTFCFLLLGACIALGTSWLFTYYFPTSYGMPCFRGVC